MKAKSFEGRRALVTGAASGIGLATARELARRGASLVLVDVDRAKLERASGELGAGARVESHGVDLGDLAAVDALAREVLAHGPVDVLVNNAGVAVVGPFARLEPRDWDWLYGVNVAGTLRLVRAILPSMIARRAGHVVVVASLAGLVGAPGMVAYSTTKFALVGFAEALRFEVEGSGVGVTTVCPGYVRTNLHKATRYDDAAFARFLDDPPSLYGLTPERVAGELCDAVQRRRAMVVLGPEKVGWWLKRVAPEVAHRVSKWVAGRAGIARGGV